MGTYQLGFIFLHKQMVMPHYKTRILLMGSMNQTSKIAHQKAFIYSIDMSDTVKASSVEID